MNVITFDVYKNTVKKHDGFTPNDSERNYTQLLFRFEKDDEWAKCSIITASFFLSADEIIKSDAELLADDLTATFSIPTDFTGKKGTLKVGLQGIYTEDEEVVTVSTNIITIDRNSGIVVQDGANAVLYEKIIELVQTYFNDDKAQIEAFITEVNTAFLSKADKATTLEGYGITDGLANGDGTVKLANLAQDILDYIVAHSNGEGGGVTLTQVQTLLADYAKASELDNKEDVSNRVTSITQAFTDESGIKYPTVLALLKYLEDYYYDFEDIYAAFDGIRIDDGNLIVLLPDGEEKSLGSVKGEKGDTGANGSDYILTDDDMTEIIETVKAEVPLVKSAEQPTFVNSVEECVDETKVYLLPDGNLYAYGQTTVTVTVETVDNETNLLPTATDASGAVYNGKGYKEQTSIEGDVEFSDSSCSLTGLIPITPTKGYVLGNNVMLFENFENPTIDKLRVSFYNSEKAHVHFVYGSSFVLEENYAANAKATYKLDNNGCVERIDFAGLMSYMNNNMGGMPAYVRIVLNGINDNSQIMFGKRVTKEETIVTEGFANTDITYTPVSDIDSEEYRTDENIGNYLDNTIPKPTFTEGYIKYNDAVVESTTHKHSSYVEVKEQQPIIIENFNCLSQTYIFCYDENKKLIHKVSGKNGYVTSYEFIPPFGVKFIRYLIANDQEATNVIYYKDSIDRNYFEKALLKSWYETAHKKINVPFENATQFPMITLIDDDTPTLSSTKLYHDTLTALGVKGGFAVITSNLDSVTGLTEQLLGYEEEGFHMVIHSNTHTPSYRPEAENRDLVAVESDFVKGIRKMGEVGFVDYKFWCTPYGVADIDMQNLARKYGMNCLVSSGCDEIVTTGDSRGRFNIARFSFNYDTTGAILARAKELVDECVANNGWLLITTHFSDDGWDEDVSTFNEFVNYALSQGCKFKTLNEAFRIREPIYRLYEMF